MENKLNQILEVKREETKKTLVQLHQEFNSVVYEILNTESEDLPPEVEERYKVALAEICKKADSYGFVLQQLESFEEHCKIKKDQWGTGQRAAARAQDRLKTMMKYVLGGTEENQLQGSEFRFFLSKPVKRLEVDENVLPKEYKKMNITYVKDMEKIEAALAQGKTIEGVTTVETRSLKSGRPKNEYLDR